VAYIKRAALQENFKTTLKSDSPTRWNSFYFVLESINSNFEKLREVLEERNQSHRLASIDTVLLGQLVPFLQYLKVVSESMESGRKPTLHKVVLTFYFVQKICSASPNDHHVLAELKLLLLRKLGQKFDLQILHWAATFLCPSKRLFSFVHPLSLRQQKLFDVKTFLICQMQKVAAFSNQNELIDESQPPPSKKAHFDPFADMDDANFGQSISTKTIEQEFSEYEATAILDPDEEYKENPLLFFKRQSLQFPRLSIVARKIFAIPATSCSSERNFSTTGRIYEKRRSHLLPKNVDAIMRTRGRMKNC
jgi:hypothetical protein